EIRQRRAALDPISRGLKGASEQIVPQRLQVVAQMGKLLDTLSYRNVLARGYALVQDGDGKVVTDAATLHPGAALHITLANGEIDAHVGGGVAPRRKSSKPGTDGSQESLF